jgi:hypothetical protein
MGDPGAGFAGLQGLIFQVFFGRDISAGKLKTKGT